MKTRFFQHLKTYSVYYCFNLGIMIGGIILGIYYLNLQNDTELLQLSETIIQILNGDYIQDKSYVISHLKESILFLGLIFEL